MSRQPRIPHPRNRGTRPKVPNHAGPPRPPGPRPLMDHNPFDTAGLQAGLPDGHTGRGKALVCRFYNVKTGCSKEAACTFLHLCRPYVQGVCKFGNNCKRSHDLRHQHVQSVLLRAGVDLRLPVKQILLLLKQWNPPEDVKPATMATALPSPSSTSSLTAAEDAPTVCLYNLRGGCRYGDRCKNVHTTWCYQWQRKPRDQWENLPKDVSIAIEKLYCDPQNSVLNVKTNDGLTKLNFETMEISLCSDPASRAPLRRLTTPSSVTLTPSPFNTVWRFYWLDNDGIWNLYGQEAKTPDGPQTSSVDSDALELVYIKDAEGTMEFETQRFKYTIDFKNMNQTNKTVGTERSIRRRPVFSDDGKPNKNKMRKKQAEAQSFNPFEIFPAHWDQSVMKSERDFFSVPVKKDSAEWTEVSQRFRETMPDSIRSITRIQNRELYQLYYLKKQHMQQKLGATARLELLLFHGTNSGARDGICQQGFDFRLSGTQSGTAYGKGSYFARDASYSHNYSPDREMFAARVLVGEYARSSASFTRPPPKDSSKPHGALYDSCVNDTASPSIHVVFEINQSYPEYIIKY